MKRTDFTDQVEVVWVRLVVGPELIDDPVTQTPKTGQVRKLGLGLLREVQAAEKGIGSAGQSAECHRMDSFPVRLELVRSLGLIVCPDCVLAPAIPAQQFGRRRPGLALL